MMGVAILRHPSSVPVLSRKTLKRTMMIMRIRACHPYARLRWARRHFHHRESGTTPDKPALTDLPTGLLVDAHVKRSNSLGKPAYLLKRGDADRGTIVLQIDRFERGCDVWTQARGLSGELGWLQAFKGQTVPREDAAEYIARLTQRDPDAWVIEIEDRDGVNPFEGERL
jgi:hypothetical protein